LSFFDDVDEPRNPPRTTPRRRRSSQTGDRRPPSDRQAIQVRRLVAAAIVVVVVVLLAVAVHGCQVSQRNASLKDYNNSVGSLIQQSDQTGKNVFRLLSTASSANITGLQQSLHEARVTAGKQLSHAQGISVPDEMKPAQQDLLLALRMRLDGITNIANQIQHALGTSTSQDAVTAIAAENARFYASDVVYTDYATHLIASALHAAGIKVRGSTGETIHQGQFLPDIQWLTPAYVASQFHVRPPGSSGKIAPGLHGHVLNSVTVSGTTLQAGSTNTIAAKPAPSFTLSFTNTGTNTETNVACKITVSGTSDSGQTTVAETSAGQSATCNVTLSSAPAAGNATVVATITPVPGEKSVANNTLSFPVTFQ